MGSIPIARSDKSLLESQMMSAPEYAEPLGEDGWNCSLDELPTVTCEECQWNGSVKDLLGVDPDENEMMWCPVCRQATWVYD